VFDLYGHDEAGIPAENHIGAAYSKRLYARHYLGIIDQYVSSGNLLEIGAGAGFFLDEARRCGFVPYALEFNPAQAKFMKENLNIACGEEALTENVFPGVEFDLVYHCDVISHFFDPVEELKRTADRTRDRGYLVFETGNLGDVAHRHYQWFTRFQYPDHLFFFSTANLKQLLESAGYELVDIHRYSILPQLRFIKWTMGLRQRLRRGGAPAPAPTPGSGKTIAEQPSPLPIVERAPGWRTKLAARLHYFLRYKIGAWVPKSDQPQTLLVIARKRPTKS